MSKTTIIAVIATAILSGGASATAAGLITGAQIKDSSVTGADIRNGTLSGSDIRDGTFTGADTRDGSLSGADIRDGSLTESDLAPRSISGNALNSGSVSAAALAPGIIILTTAGCPDGTTLLQFASLQAGLSYSFGEAMYGISSFSNTITTRPEHSISVNLCLT